MKSHVLILGDTLAGLVAAWRLCTAEYRVTILKATDTLHEATASANPPNEIPDSPIVYGSHAYTDSLLQDLGISRQESGWKRVALEFKTEASASARFSCPPFPAPWHTLWGLATFSALPYRERWRMLTYLEKVWEGVTALPSALDLQTADVWLTNNGQTAAVQKTIWNPLCRFLMGTSLSHTRAGSFTAMLARVFFQTSRRSPRITPLPKVATLLAQSLTERLKQRSAGIDRVPAIEHLQVGAERVTGVRASDGTLYTADWYVAAVHPTTLASFLPERLLARYSSFHQMSQAPFSPMVRFTGLSDHTITTPRLILHDGRFSWTLCHPTDASKDHATLLSCVSTGDAAFLSESDDRIQACALDTLHTVFPDHPFSNPERLHRSHITRQPLGFVPHMPGTEPSRPSNQTPIRNFLLAGSWTDTNASTEIESAIASGNLCAEILLDHPRALTSRNPATYDATL